jgi:hypothetical protein
VLLAALVLASLAAVPPLASRARAEWLQPDPTYKEALLLLRLALRDTIGRSQDPARLDSLGLALFRLARFDEAVPVLEKSLALEPRGETPRATLGKLALFENRLAAAESLLAGVRSDPDAQRDLYAVRLRREDWKAAAAMAPDVEDPGRVALLEAMAEGPVYEMTALTKDLVIPWSVSYPIPLVRVKLNGQSVLMAIDTGARDLLLDPSVARRCKVREVPGQHLEFWSGSRVAVKNAMVDRLEIGGSKIGRLPAGTLPLRKWSIEVNPHAEQVAGVIGIELLRRFTPTLDYAKARLILHPRGSASAVQAGAQRVPFQIWGLSEVMVFGSLAGGRRMAMVVQSGVPGCGVGAPPEVFEEVGVKAGMMSRLVKSAGSWTTGRPWTQCSVPTVSVGPVVAARVDGWSGALDSSEMWRHGVRRDALVSHDFFRGKRVTIDWEKRELLFEE